MCYNHHFLPLDLPSHDCKLAAMICHVTPCPPRKLSCIFVLHKNPHPCHHRHCPNTNLSEITTIFPKSARHCLLSARTFLHDSDLLHCHSHHGTCLAACLMTSLFSLATTSYVMICPSAHLDLPQPGGSYTTPVLEGCLCSLFHSIEGEVH